MSPTTNIYSEAQRVEILSALATCDGMPKHAAKRLVEQGLDITWQEVRQLREEHATTYQALASEIGRAREEAAQIAFRENNALAQKLTNNFLHDLLERQESGDLTRDEVRALPQIVQAMQKVSQVSTDKLLSLSGRPTDGGSGNPLEAAQWLIDAGVLEPVKRPAIEPAIDTTAEEA